MLSVPAVKKKLPFKFSPLMSYDSTQFSTIFCVDFIGADEAPNFKRAVMSIWQPWILKKGPKRKPLEREYPDLCKKLKPLETEEPGFCRNNNWDLR